MLQHPKLALALTASGLALTAALPLQASTRVLYDGSLGTTPAEQGLVYAAIPNINYTATSSGATTLNTSASNGIYAGYFADPGTLDRFVGFGVEIDLKINSGSTSNISRSGFNLIVLDQNARGVELGFLPGEIFAQDDDPLFVRDEVLTFDTTASVRRYRLDIFQSSWSLSIDGSPSLSGLVRDYSAFTGTLDPYETPNLFFVGDNTTSAGGSATFSRIVIVPEPTSALLAFGVALVTLRRSR